MISIIISTYRSYYLKNLIKNIKNTVGIEHEVIAIDNSGAKKGLCAVYNEGARKAKYPLLCFMHEDIDIKTNQWGKIVCQLFDSNAKLGLVGVAGSSYKARVPSGWGYQNVHWNSVFNNFIQSDETSIGNGIHVHNNPKNELLSKVATVDGFWFCTRKSVAMEYSFDEVNFKGFHCYDLDFALSVGQKYDVAVTYEVLIEHFSHGSFNKQWLDEAFKLHIKWGNKLPVNLAGYNKEDQNLEEEKAFLSLLHYMNKAKYTSVEMYKLLWSRNIRSLFTLKTFTKLNLAVNKVLYKLGK